MEQIHGVHISKNEFLECPIKAQDQVLYSSLGSVARSLSEDLAQESTLGLSGDENDSAGDLSAIKPETPTEAPQEDYKTNAGEGILGCPLSVNIGEGPMALIGQNSEAMENEEKNLDRNLLEISVSPNESTGETSEAVSKLEKTSEKTSDPVAGDVTVQSEKDQTDEGGPKISPTYHSLDLKSVERLYASADPAHEQAVNATETYSARGGDLVEVFKPKEEENENILVLAGKLPDTAASMSEDAKETSEVRSISEKIDVKPLDPVAVDGFVQVKEGLTGGEVVNSFPSDLSPDLQSIEQTDTSADAAQGLNLAVSGGLIDLDKAKGEKNEAVLLEPDGTHSVDNPEITIEYYNVHDVMKSNLPMTLDSCELTKDIGDDTNESVSEANRPNIQSRQLASCTDAAPSEVQAFEDKLKQDDVWRNPTFPVEGEAGVSEIKFAICENRGLDELGAPSEDSRSEMDKNQTICSLAEEGPHDSSKELLAVQPENATTVLPTTLVSPLDPEICQKTNSVDNNSGGDHEKARSENYGTARSDIAEGAAEDNIIENGKAVSEHMKTVSNSQANEALNLLEDDSAGDIDKIKKEGTEGCKEENIVFGGESAGNHDKVEIKEKKSREGEEENVMNTSGVASSLSEFLVAAEDDMNVPVRKLPETEYRSLHEASDPIRVEIDINRTHSSLQNQDKGFQELAVSKDDDVKVQCSSAVGGVAESNLDVEKLSLNADNQPIEESKLKAGDFESSVQCLTLVEEDQAQMLDGKDSVISSSMKEPMHMSGDAEPSTLSSVAVKDNCTGLLAGDASVICSSTKEPKPAFVDAESPVQSTIAVDDQIGGSAPGIKLETLQVEENSNGIDRQHGVFPLDVSIDSGSQTDSLEGNWGSVSGNNTSLL